MPLAGLKCFAGTAWQFAQLADGAGCENVQFAPGCAWHCEQGVNLPLIGLKCVAEGVWQVWQSWSTGWVNPQFEPALWQTVQGGNEPEAALKCLAEYV